MNFPWAKWLVLSCLLFPISDVGCGEGKGRDGFCRRCAMRNCCIANLVRRRESIIRYHIRLSHPVRCDGLRRERHFTNEGKKKKKISIKVSYTLATVSMTGKLPLT